MLSDFREFHNIHWFCQPCEIEIRIKAIKESAKNTDSEVSDESTVAYLQECQKAVQVISEEFRHSCG